MLGKRSAIDSPQVMVSRVMEHVLVVGIGITGALLLFYIVSSQMQLRSVFGTRQMGLVGKI